MVKNMIWGTALVTSLLAAGAQASVGAMGDLGPRSDMLEARMDNQALPLLQERQDSAVNLPQSQPAPGTLDLDKWEQETTQLCMQSLAQLTAASNPAGAAVCYNLMSLDTKNGSFMADLRLFQVSSASGTFSGIPSEKIQVGLQYHGASVSPLSANKTAAAAQSTQSGVAKRADQARQLQQYLLVGQIDKKEMEKPMTMGLLEALVLPQVTLSAVNAGGNTVSTNISSNEAAFVNGVFSKEVIMSETSRAQTAVNDIKAGLANGTVAFVLPGVSLMIFPVGLVITGLWTVLAFATYGYGTYNRINYRHTFRTRSLMAGKGVQKTI